MPPERFPPDDPREWLNRARSSLALAKTHLPEAYLEDLCFQAHQAAEKAIKALLIKQGVVFPYVHDLARLLTILEEAGEPMPETIRNAEELTRYVVMTRYPRPAEPVTEAQYKEAMATAEAVIQWAANRLRELG